MHIYHIEKCPHLKLRPSNFARCSSQTQQKRRLNSEASRFARLLSHFRRFLQALNQQSSLTVCNSRNGLIRSGCIHLSLYGVVYQTPCYRTPSCHTRTARRLELHRLGLSIVYVFRRASTPDVWKRRNGIQQVHLTDTVSSVALRPSCGLYRNVVITFEPYV